MVKLKYLLALILTINNSSLGMINRADMNLDGEVDFLDFAVLCNEWLWESSSLSPHNDMVFIEIYTFMMGDQWGIGDPDEKPVHQVRLSPFYMSRYEITNYQYVCFLNSSLAKGSIYIEDIENNSVKVYSSTSPHILYFLAGNYASLNMINYIDEIFQIVVFNVPQGRGTGNNNSFDFSLHPVIEVSWYGAAAYCNWLSEKEGYELCYDVNWVCDISKNGYRLPTEAEWEQSSAICCKPRCASFPYPCSLIFDPNGINCEDLNPANMFKEPHTIPVQDCISNFLGICGMNGNVREWCNDVFSETYYGESPILNPTGPNSDYLSDRVIRGGAWNLGDENYCRNTNRSWGNPSYYANNVGFRVVRSHRD